MSSCPACATWRGGWYQTGCRDCSLRNIARGPDFFASVQQGGPTDAYKAQLDAVARKSDPPLKRSQVHAEVEAWAARLVDAPAA